MSVYGDKRAFDFTCCVFIVFYVFMWMNFPLMKNKDDVEGSFDFIC